MGAIIRPELFRIPLSARDRFRRTMQFQSVDRVPHFEFGYWNETYAAWHAQGMPREIDTEKKANRYFGFDRFELSPVNDWNWLCPPFEEKVLAEDERHRTIIDKEGCTCIVNKDGSSSIPHVLDYPLKDRESWLRIRERLDPRDPHRYPPGWEDLKASYHNRDYPLGIHAGSLLGFLRDLMGFENIAIAFHEMPDLVQEMVDDMVDFNIAVMEPLLRDIDFDYANGWEDIAFRNGPLIGPAMFRRFLLPGYKRIAALLRAHGINVIFTDCDGDINAIVDLWIEAGFTCQFPLEVAAGTDPIALRERFGERVLLIGGVNKRALIAGREEIDREMKRLEPLVAQGGFIPHVDHRCPPDVSFENYLYYLEAKKRILGF
ncbi:MAG: hypothetical protein NT005_06690 [Spirochaetes bacterium]|nr:hypothetical protein [Spirochaetota bacterium]